MFCPRRVGSRPRRSTFQGFSLLFDAQKITQINIFFLRKFTRKPPIDSGQNNLFRTSALWCGVLHKQRQNKKNEIYHYGARKNERARSPNQTTHLPIVMAMACYPIEYHALFFAGLRSHAAIRAVCIPACQVMH